MYPSAKRKRPSSPSKKGGKHKNKLPFEPAKLSYIDDGSKRGPGSGGLTSVQKDEVGSGKKC